LADAQGSCRLQDETAKVEDALLEESSVEAIQRTFSRAKSASFENILEPLLKVRLATVKAKA
jgi:hypothetical protein